MSFAAEWILAVHRAVWFPVLWATGLEAAAAEDDWSGAPEVKAGPAGTVRRCAPIDQGGGHCRTLDRRRAA
jgi:hypothetical protein